MYNDCLAKIKRMLKTCLSKLGVGLIRLKSGRFYTCYDRPVYSKDIMLVPDYCRGEKVGIVLQGPLLYQDDFTLETVKMYRKLYPETYLVLSTWQGENEVVINAIRNIGVDVIQSEKPNHPLRGHAFNNFQIVSSQTGIDRAIQEGCKYIMKTRTDQRMYGDGNISFFLDMMTIYPLTIKAPAKGRLVATSLGTFSNRLYNVSDMLIFGYAEDVAAYFNCPMDERPHQEIVQGNDLIEYSENRPGEIYFSTHYLEHNDWKLKWTITDSLQCFKEMFIIVDAEMLDLFWPKYTKREYRWRKYKPEESPLDQLTFKKWLEIYSQ